MRTTTKKSLPKAQNGTTTPKRKIIDSQPVPSKYQKKTKTPVNPRTVIGQKGGAMKKMQGGGPTSTVNKAPKRRVLPQIAAAIGAGSITAAAALKEDIKKANARRKAKKAEKKENKNVDTATPKQQYGGARRKPSGGMKSIFGGKRKISKSCKSGNCTPMRG
jgi:hypothetical protein